MAIGCDTFNSISRAFGGSISSVALFTNSLSAAQIETLFDYGVAQGSLVPIIAANLTTSYQFATNPSGVTATFAASALGFGLTNGGYWQRSTSAGVWVTLTNGNNGADIAGGAVVPISYLTNVNTTLTITNASTLDAGSYRLIITNSFGKSATSAVATISFVIPAANSFAATALNPAYGAVAYWPLNETVDPSTGMAEAFELIGGFNGTYGINADNGGGNALAGFARAVGPQPPGLAGFPSPNYAFADLNTNLNNTFVTVPATPTFQAGTTNATIVAWVNPNLFTEAPNATLLIMRSGYLGATRTDGFRYGPSANNHLGYNWDNNNGTTTAFDSGLAVPSNIWSMVALVISPSNSMFYLANTNTGLTSATQWMTNATGSTNDNEPWGGAIIIGSDPGNSATTPNVRAFGGAISSLVMFSNSLSSAQLATLFDAGLALNSQSPFISQNPLSSQLLPGFAVNATFAAGGFGGTLANGSYWQVKYPSSSGWVTMVNGANNGGGIAGGTQAANTNNLNLSSILVVSNATAADVGSYQLVLTNASGVSVTSAVATLSFISTTVQANSFEQYALTNGIVAFWPLNETNDPSSGVAVAYDIVGGFNGLYGANAANAAGNAADALAAVPGPAAGGLSGFASGGALGSQQNGMANTFVTTLASPAFPAAGSAGWNTNVTIIAWIKPNTSEAGNTGLLMQRAGSQVDGLKYGATANTLGYSWANNSTANNFSGPAIPTNTWSMAATVITASNSTLYVGSSNSVVLAAQTLANANQTWGGPLSIGGDPGSNPITLSFGGSMSSVAMFSNALSAVQIEALYVAGQDSGVVPPPVITANPPVPSVQLVAGLNATLTAAGFGILPAGGYWQKSTSPGVWVNVNSAGHISGTNAALSGTVQQGTLVISNVTVADNASYQLIVSNSVGSVTSSVVSLSVITGPAANTFAAAAIYTNHAVAFWPLNETADPSTGTVTAWDIAGGNNGTYGTNAQDGGPNAWIAANNSQYNFSPVPGPAAAGLVGFASGGALGSLQNVLPATYVTTTASPAFPINNTNVSMVAWIYPKTNLSNHAGLITMRAGTARATQTDGLATGLASGQLGYIWDNNASGTSAFASGLTIPVSNWSMVGLVITPSNSTLYVGTNMFGTNTIVRSATQTIVNSNAPFGAGIEIGTDPATLPNFSFGGYISSVAMFNTSLSAAQMENLFNVGESNGLVAPPFIISNPVVTNIELLAGSTGSSGGALTVTASGYGTQPCGGYWQVWNPGSASWVLATNAYGFSGGTNAPLVNTLQVGTLAFTNFQASNAGSYRLVITNAAGLTPASGAAISTVVTVSAYTPPAGGYAAVASGPGYGAVALWPLNETGDASTGTVVAYDIIGGFNGSYAVNAQNGGVNTGLASGPYAASAFQPVPGPAALGQAGFPAGGALGSIQNASNTFVSSATSPTFPGLNSAVATALNNSTNVTIVAWCNPNVFPESGNAPFLIERSPYLGAARTAGFRIYGNSAGVAVVNDLGFAWDNNTANAYNFDSGLNVPVNMWSMVALVISPSNAVFYLGNVSQGLLTSAVVMSGTNVNEPWGSGVVIGSDPGSTANGRSFGGAISSVTMFSNSLSLAQIGNLFAAGAARRQPGAHHFPQPALAPVDRGRHGGHERHCLRRHE